MTNKELATFDKDSVGRLKAYMGSVGSIATTQDFRRWLVLVNVQDFGHALRVSEGWAAGFALGYACGRSGLGDGDHQGDGLGTG